ncbi:hypothetical protein HT094_19290 [Shewanella sp. ZOR0012]|nr:hypothetical protein [Shewanella sp. ZOR0012]
MFIHISVLKKMARKPKVGDSILYQTEVQNDGKIKAVIASIEGVAVLAATPTSTAASRTPQVNRGNKSANTKKTQSSLNRLISILLFVALAGFGYKAFQQRQETIIEEKPAAYSEYNLQNSRTQHNTTFILAKSGITVRKQKPHTPHATCKVTDQHPSTTRVMASHRN